MCLNAKIIFLSRNYKNMPSGRGYRRRRRLTKLTTYKPRAMNLQFSGGPVTGSRFQQAAAAYEVAKGAYQLGNATYGQLKYAHGKLKAAMGAKPKVKKLKQTKALTRKDFSNLNKKKKNNKNRHNNLKKTGTQPVNKGKGMKGKYKSRLTGVTVTHPTLPKWKIERKKKYKEGIVYQTVFLSRSNRLSGGANQLASSRYPLRLPETINTDTTQTCIFTPFCSHYSGVHTTFFQHVNPAGTGLIHATHADHRLDVVQQRADIRRHSLPSSVENTKAGVILYNKDDVPASTTQLTQNTDNALIYIDQYFRKIKLDLVFTSCRNFDTLVSVSVIRRIQPGNKYSLTTAEIQDFCNDIDNRGMEYTDFKQEYHTTFILRKLKERNPPPTRSLNHTIVCDWLQTNCFKDVNTSDIMSDANTTLLGQGIVKNNLQPAENEMAGNTFILIKYKKVRSPQVFTYEKVIEYSRTAEAQGWGVPSASVQLPALSEETIDISAHVGVDNSDGTEVNDGKPFENDTQNETKACCYVHGKIIYEWGFREDSENINSVMSTDETSTDFNKPLSLNIDPTLIGNNNHGLYTQSQDHENN